jgi:hypothetical protein
VPVRRLPSSHRARLRGARGGGVRRGIPARRLELLHRILDAEGALR